MTAALPPLRLTDVTPGKDLRRRHEAIYGGALNATIPGLIKLTAFYQESRRNMIDYQGRFEAAMRRADTNLEKPSDI